MRVDPPVSEVVRPHEQADPVAAVLAARATGLLLALPTSGTTARGGREVVRTTDSWWDSFDAYSHLAGVGAGSRVWVPGPLTSTMNLFAAVHAGAVGAEVVDVPDAATDACLTPTQLDQHLDRLPTGLRVVVAGAALRPDLARRAGSFGVRLSHYYGAAELSFVAWGDDGAPLQPFPGVEVETRADPVAGTLWVRSAYLCQGYAGPAGSLRVDALGWATVGDLGAVGPAGVSVHGRPDAIITGGACVLIADVEAALRPVAAGEFAVHATSHAQLGQVVTVTIVEASDRARLEDHARAMLPTTHRPRRWRVVDALPLTAAGKLDRRTLEDGQ